MTNPAYSNDITNDDFLEKIRQINTTQKSRSDMMKKNSKLILILLSALLLLACNNNSEKSDTKVTYQQDFPEEFSPALLDFLQTYSMPIYTNFTLKDDRYMYSQFDVGQNPEEIIYYTASENRVNDYFTPLLHTDDIDSTFLDLTNNFSEKILDTKESKRIDSFPEATLDEENNITLRTIQGEKSFDLVKELAEFDLHEGDALEISIPAANDISFFLNIKNVDAEGANQYIHVYSNQDFTKFTAVSGYYQLFKEHIQKGELDNFKNLIFETELNDQYTILHNSNQVFDKISKELHWIDGNTDSPSIDGKYIYLQGKDTPLSEGIQHIQKTEDYLEGNKQMYAEFELDYKEIANQLDIESVGIGLANIVYFNEDYIVLFLAFNSAVTGSAGSTNVIVDFQEDKENPTLYLVDLGLQ